MQETILDGIVLGLIPVTLLGLFVSAYLQLQRDKKLMSQTTDSQPVGAKHSAQKG